MRPTGQAEINGFEGGLITDVNPLENPPNTTSDELNMVLNTDKSRSRRLGFDYELGYSLIDSGVALQSSLGVIGTSTFNWKNAGGDEDKELFVVQVGTNLKIFDLDNNPITSTVVYTEDFTSSYTEVFSYAVVDGILVVSTGLKNVNVYEYSSGVVTKTETSLLIRDLFGVEAQGNSVELTDPQNFQVRPTDLTDEHLYNLRNSTFSNPYYIGNTETLQDPVTAFNTNAGVYPANADSLIRALYADANDSGDRNIERFWPDVLENTPVSSSPAPTGFFIIDALERGTSRLAQESQLRSNNSALSETVASLPLDQTPGGASVITEHSGRVWYGGFSGEVTDGDSKSPRMSSYVLFSRLVRDTSDIGRCYQDADPTSNIDPEIVDTDGGFIRLDGAYDIRAMISVSSILLVFAKNGVWAVTGGESTGFRATDFTVNKVTDNGLDAKKSVVIVDNNIFYWGKSLYMPLLWIKSLGSFSPMTSLQGG